MVTDETLQVKKKVHCLLFFFYRSGKSKLRRPSIFGGKRIGNTFVGIVFLPPGTEFRIYSRCCCDSTGTRGERVPRRTRNGTGAYFLLS